MRLVAGAKNPRLTNSFPRCIIAVSYTHLDVYKRQHVLDVAEKLCDKVAIIKNGRLAAFGDTDAVRGDGSLEELFLELVEK